MKMTLDDLFELSYEPEPQDEGFTEELIGGLMKKDSRLRRTVRKGVVLGIAAALAASTALGGGNDDSGKSENAIASRVSPRPLDSTVADFESHAASPLHSEAASKRLASAVSRSVPRGVQRAGGTEHLIEDEPGDAEKGPGAGWQSGDDCGDTSETTNQSAGPAVDLLWGDVYYRPDDGILGFASGVVQLAEPGGGHGYGFSWRIYHGDWSFTVDAERSEDPPDHVYVSYYEPRGDNLLSPSFWTTGDHYIDCSDCDLLWDLEASHAEFDVPLTLLNEAAAGASGGKAPPIKRGTQLLMTERSLLRSIHSTDPHASSYGPVDSAPDGETCTGRASFTL